MGCRLTVPRHVVFLSAHLVLACGVAAAVGDAAAQTIYVGSEHLPEVEVNLEVLDALGAARPEQQLVIPGAGEKRATIRLKTPPGAGAEQPVVTLSPPAVSVEPLPPPQPPAARPAPAPEADEARPVPLPPPQPPTVKPEPEEREAKAEPAPAPAPTVVAVTTQPPPPPPPKPTSEQTSGPETVVAAAPPPTEPIPVAPAEAGSSLVVAPAAGPAAEDASRVESQTAAAAGPDADGAPAAESQTTAMVEPEPEETPQAETKVATAVPAPEPTLEAPAEPPPPKVAALPPAKTPGAPAPGDSLRIEFADNSSDLAKRSREKLKLLAELLLGADSLRAQVKAYAGETAGSASAARRLSLSRALAVRAFLIDEGVRSTRIDVRALGNRFEGGPSERVDIVIANR